ncbi:hypothetical protein QTP88_004903 [Uroleucon formosanum]
MYKNKDNKQKSQNKFLTENERSGDHESSVELIDSFFTINDISRDKIKVAPYRVKLVIGVPNGGPPILGRNDIATLGIKNVFECKFTGAEDSVKAILKKYPNVFSEKLGTFKGYEISFTTRPGTTPKFFKHRPLPQALRIKVEAEIDRLLATNALIPVNHSEWATPVFPIFKGGGSVRLCGDFKITINPVLVGTESPLPKIEHLYAGIAGAKYFSKIDLKDAYQQLVLNDSSRALTIINTIKGLFRYTRVPFGLKSSASEFQKAIESITKKVEGVEVFIDDIIVSGRTMSEHNIRMEQLSIQLRRAEARILKSLYDLLKMGAKWSWSKEADEAFNNIKSILSSKPVLDHYEPSVPIKLMVGASSFAIGAVISQVYGNAEKPVAYASRVLSEAERKYPQIEKEGLAIIYGVQKF